MVIFVVFYYVLWFFNIIIDIRNVCVFLVLMFLSFIIFVIYWFIKEFKVRVFKFFYCICVYVLYKFLLLFRVRVCSMLCFDLKFLYIIY